MVLNFRLECAKQFRFFHLTAHSSKKTTRAGYFPAKIRNYLQFMTVVQSQNHYLTEGNGDACWRLHCVRNSVSRQIAWVGRYEIL
jgi:hypothetical protein